MKSKPHNFFRSIYRYSLNNREFTSDDGLAYWREKIFNGLILMLLLAGTIALPPNIIASIATKTHLITVTDFAVYIAVFFLFFYRTIKLKYKIIGTIVLIYFLSIVLLFELGPMGPGFIWLASCSLFAALLLGLWASVITIVINICIIAIIAGLISWGGLNTIFFNTYSVINWIAVSVNVILFNSLTSIPLALLLNALEKSIETEKALKAQILLYNKQLEIEKIKAQESDRSKSAFLANLSHDVRTPMNAIMGFSELIQIECKSNEKASLFGDQILQNSFYLNHLINDIVDISLIESGQMKINRQITPLESFIDDLKKLVATFDYWNERPELNLFYKIEPEILDQNVWIDAHHLKQILINLITNAIKNTPQGQIIFSIKKDKAMLIFIVEDNGIGIPKEEQNKIFKRFSKIDRKNPIKNRSIGLGLSISKALTETMGGNIWFESEEHIGSTFMVSIPINILNTN